MHGIYEMTARPPTLTVTERCPDGFLQADARTLHDVLPGPTLIHLAGERSAPLFVSVLLHGNEDVGLRAVQRILVEAGARPLPRALSILVGNVAAARENVRRLEGQPDYNRIWPGTDLPPTSEHALMAQVVEEMRARHVFASLDLHNNTGVNPIYGCVTRLRHPDLQLASMLARTVVYFRRPLGVQTMAFAELCPSVTCECGKPGDETGVARAAEYLQACLQLAEHVEHPVRTGDVHLFHTVATVKIPEAITFSFDASAADLQFSADLEWFNFRETPAGTVFARCARHAALCMDVRNEDGEAVGERFFERDGELIRLRHPVMPSMLTRDERVIRQDCLCYFMERYPLPS
jgi:succinylglutamate desuccinylase